MENGYDGKLAEKFSGLGINNQNGQQQQQQHVHDDHQPDNNNNNNDNLFQVMKAVEAAEATIKQQVLYLWFQVSTMMFNFSCYWFTLSEI